MRVTNTERVPLRFNAWERADAAHQVTRTDLSRRVGAEDYLHCASPYVIGRDPVFPPSCGCHALSTTPQLLSS